MTILGLVNKIQRSINKQIQKIKKKLSRPGKKKKKEAEEPVETEIPRSWLEKRKHQQPASSIRRKKPLVAEDTGEKIILKKRKVLRVSWLLTFKRGLAALLLFINFVISQFLLASNTQAAPAFIFFMGNCFILLDYLWKTRRQGES
jgi:hypothetical protein